MPWGWCFPTSVHASSHCCFMVPGKRAVWWHRNQPQGASGEGGRWVLAERPGLVGPSPWTTSPPTCVHKVDKRGGNLVQQFPVKRLPSASWGQQLRLVSMAVVPHSVTHTTVQRPAGIVTGWWYSPSSTADLNAHTYMKGTKLMRQHSQICNGPLTRHVRPHGRFVSMDAPVHACTSAAFDGRRAGG